MAKLKLGALEDDKPVKVAVDLPAAIYRNLLAYAEILSQETGKAIADPAKLIPPMVERFMATDRGFLAARNGRKPGRATTNQARVP